ncbi:exported protein of unknown function [Thermococcus nautili]|nr:exported protein of unknown function [Thermococcus nautili]
MRKAVVVFLIVLVVLSGMVHPTVKALSKTQTGERGVINPFFEGYLKSLQNATPDERKAILALIEVLLNGTLSGDVVVSDYMKIKNAHWNGTDLIFQIWWYNGTEPALIKTYLWQNPYSALSAVATSARGTLTKTSRFTSNTKAYLKRPELGVKSSA